MACVTLAMENNEQQNRWWCTRILLRILVIFWISQGIKKWYHKKNMWHVWHRWGEHMSSTIGDGFTRILQRKWGEEKRKKEKHLNMMVNYNLILLFQTSKIYQFINPSVTAIKNKWKKLFCRTVNWHKKINIKWQI